MQFNLEGRVGIQSTKYIQSRHTLDSRKGMPRGRKDRALYARSRGNYLYAKGTRKAVTSCRSCRGIYLFLFIFAVGLYFRVELSGSLVRPSNACYVIGYIHIGLWKGKASGTGTIWGGGLEGEGGGFKVTLLKVNAMVLP